MMAKLVTAPSLALVSPPDSEPPRVIRAVSSFWTVTAKGHPYHVGFRDVYSGDEAARLSGLHPDRFEAYAAPVPR